SVAGAGRLRLALLQQALHHVVAPAHVVAAVDHELEHLSGWALDTDRPVDGDHAPPSAVRAPPARSKPTYWPGCTSGCACSRRASAAVAAPGSRACVIARTTTTRRAPAASTSPRVSGPI